MLGLFALTLDPDLNISTSMPDLNFIKCSLVATMSTRPFVNLVVVHLLLAIRGSADRYHEHACDKKQTPMKHHSE
jgi:hypothetical protein